MKRTFCALIAIAGILFADTLMAQENSAKDSTAKKHHRSLVISNKGVKIVTTDSIKSKVGKIENDGEKEENDFSLSYAMLDIGINILRDNADYSSASVKKFLNVPASMQNSSLFDLRQGKSINVNINPVMVGFKALKTHGQRIYISTGLGFQFYNFRYESPITFTKNPSGVILDNVTFKKDKLAMDYLNIPLMLTFKTRLHGDEWLVYGFGITEGYRIASWTKQESGTRGKVKVSDAFGLADWNTCITGEFGVEGIVRFYASYQVTSMFGNGLDQHPVSFGFRIGGR